MARETTYSITEDGVTLHDNYLAAEEVGGYTLVFRAIDTQRIEELINKGEEPLGTEILSIPNLAVLGESIHTDIMGRIPAIMAGDGSIRDSTARDRPHLPSNWRLKKVGRSYIPLEKRWRPVVNTAINDIDRLALMLIEGLEMYLSTIGDDVVYISYSGGIDSTLLLLVADRVGIETRIVTTTTPGSGEEERVMEALSKLGIGAETSIAVIDEDNLRRYLDIAARYIDIENPILQPIAVAEYASMSLVPKNRRLLMGQGADELFGGYDKYRREIENYKTNNLIDIATLQYTTTLLEWRIASDIGIYVDYPYTHTKVLETSLLTPPRYKVMGREDRHRKWVIRKALEILGAPKEIYMRPKKAMQYSTGLKKLIKRTAEE